MSIFCFDDVKVSKYVVNKYLLSYFNLIDSVK